MSLFLWTSTLHLPPAHFVTLLPRETILILQTFTTSGLALVAAPNSIHGYAFKKHLEASRMSSGDQPAQVSHSRHYCSSDIPLTKSCNCNGNYSASCLFTINLIVYWIPLWFPSPVSCLNANVYLLGQFCLPGQNFLLSAEEQTKFRSNIYTQSSGSKDKLTAWWRFLSWLILPNRVRRQYTSLHLRIRKPHITNVARARNPTILHDNRYVFSLEV
jgi:hypothetical protein